MSIFFLFYIVYLIVSISVHEFAHALAADRLGDPTARAAGRLTLNPFAHIDTIGTILLPLSFFLLSNVFQAQNPIIFGWGKPTPFDPYNLKNPRRDSAIISVAGPLSNLFLATLVSIAIRFLPYIWGVFLIPLILTNIGLAVFNLIPVGPLDGQKILVGILPRDLAYEFQSVMNRYGVIILLLLIFPIFGQEAPVVAIMNPIIDFLVRILVP